MAQFRQLMYDATALQDHIRYFADAEGSIQPPKRDGVLESLFPLINGDAHLFANVDSPEGFERVMILNNEFSLNVIIVSGKSLHDKADELGEMGIPVLASIELPEIPDWMKEDEDDEARSQEEERYRERQAEAFKAAAENIRTLLDEEVTVGFASAGLGADKLHEHLRELKEKGGLSEDEILQLLTVNTAEILEISETLGQLDRGFNASFAVFNSPFLEEESAVKMVISNGEIHEF
ncbi:MAG: amidohydrolase family protein [Bacteroidetes bacterium]|nr:amidohydrolase family protein [Bacteroidota bacterium]